MASQSILGIIKALREKSVQNGCTEAEAMAAAEKIDHLIRKYRVEQSELEEGEAERDPLGKKKKDLGDYYAAVSGALTAIERYCDVKIWYASEDPMQKQRKRVTIFGHQSDVAVAEYFVDVIGRAMRDEVFAWSFTNGMFGKSKAETRADELGFCKGMAHRVHERLTKMKADQRSYYAQSTGKDLCVARKGAVDAWLRANGYSFSKVRSSGARMNYGAYDAGQKAGDNVALHTAVGSNGRAQAVRQIGR